MPPARPSRPVALCFSGDIYDTHEHLSQHVQDKGHRFKCTASGCHAIAGSASALASSAKHTGPGHEGSVELAALLAYQSNPAIDEVAADICHICGAQQKNADGVAHHQRDKHSKCPSCHRMFPTQATLEGHQKAVGHCYCHEHELLFPDAKSFRAHERRKPHVTGFECLDCTRTYASQYALDHHLDTCLARDLHRVDEQAANAYAAATLAKLEEDLLRCEACERPFCDVNALRQHKRSVKHNPISDIRCFLSPRCNKAFTSVSAWVFHIESGGCKSGMNRLKLNALIHAVDADNKITFQENTRRLAPAGEADAASLFSRLQGLSLSSSGVMLTPSQSSVSSAATASGPVQAAAAQDADTASTSSTTSTIIGDPSAPRTYNTTVQTTSDGDSDDEFYEAETASTVTSGSGGAILTPSGTMTPSSTGGVVLTPAGTSTAGEWSFLAGYSGDADALLYDQAKGVWACPDCTFNSRTKARLLQHLNSPAHETKLYHCAGISAAASAAAPGAKKKPERKFKTLSGLAQHVEAGACAGGKEGLNLIAAMFEGKLKETTGKEVTLVRRDR